MTLPAASHADDFLVVAMNVTPYRSLSQLIQSTYSGVMVGYALVSFLIAGCLQFLFIIILSFIDSLRTMRACFSLRTKFQQVRLKCKLSPFIHFQAIIIVLYFLHHFNLIALRRASLNYFSLYSFRYSFFLESINFLRWLTSSYNCRLFLAWSILHCSTVCPGKSMLDQCYFVSFRVFQFYLRSFYI